MDYPNGLRDDFVQLARLALAEKQHDVRLFLRRAVKRYRSVDSGLADNVNHLLQRAPARSALLRDASAPVPVDSDSRLELLRIEHDPRPDVEPILPESARSAVLQLISEYRSRETLAKADLEPSRSALLVGPPGVGKSLSARWIAQELRLPLMVLDLSAVMSSFLGRTGNNLRSVLDFAKSVNGVLLIDELDAVGKRRDDVTEVGELKRLVTVLLQEIDSWHSDTLLLAATNHSSLLDPAIWRRFDIVVEFPMPKPDQVALAIHRFLGPDEPQLKEYIPLLATILSQESYGVIQREMLRVRRRIAVAQVGAEDAVLGLVERYRESLDHQDRIVIAVDLVSAGHLSQRAAQRLLGVSRDTIRKALSDRSP